MTLSFTGAHVPQDILLTGIRWSLASPLRTRHGAARMCNSSCAACMTYAPSTHLTAIQDAAVPVAQEE
jgi:hypothetical protein